MNIEIKKKIKSVAVVIIAVLLGFLLILSAGAGVAYLSFDRLRDTRIGFFDSEAAQIGLIFKGFLEDNRKNLDIPNDETIIITGKCYDRFNMTAFANEYLKEDTIISDLNSKAGKGKYYWAVKVVDGNVSEVWFSKKELNESDMRPYNNQERRDRMKLVIPLFSPVRFFKYGYIDDSEVYGYCRFKK